MNRWLRSKTGTLWLAILSLVTSRRTIVDLFAKEASNRLHTPMSSEFHGADTSDHNPATHSDAMPIPRMRMYPVESDLRIVICL